MNDELLDSFYITLLNMLIHYTHSLLLLVILVVILMQISQSFHCRGNIVSRKISLKLHGIDSNKQSDRVHTSIIPQSIHNIYTKKQIENLKNALIFCSSTAFINYPKKQCQAVSGITDSSLLYVDKTENFKILIPEGWVNLPRKQPSVTLSKYQSEDILLVSSNFNEGVSLSVTKTNARRLLKDFEIEWWFGDLNSIQDIGDADLISKLLILQRQNNFDGKIQSATELKSSKIDSQQNLYFDFNTPIADAVMRKSKSKCFYHNNYLYVLWINALGSVFDSDYNMTINEIMSSFEAKV